jgi:uncharacterized protein (DUF2267 family)
MQHDEFIGQVQSRARLASRGEAEVATRATLETLGERLELGLAENVASQLPLEIGRYLLDSRPFERISVEDFFDRVSLREGMDRPKAVHHARAVLEVLEEATRGVMDKVRLSLPEEFMPLFSGSEGKMPG